MPQDNPHDIETKHQVKIKIGKSFCYRTRVCLPLCHYHCGHQDRNSSVPAGNDAVKKRMPNAGST